MSRSGTGLSLRLLLGLRLPWGQALGRGLGGRAARAYKQVRARAELLAKPVSIITGGVGFFFPLTIPDYHRDGGTAGAGHS